jgi:hypothetical protein
MDVNPQWIIDESVINRVRLKEIHWSGGGFLVELAI